MNDIYIGDRQLEPDDEPDNICEYCEGHGSTNATWSDPLGDQCPECLGAGLAESLDHLNDPGEPNEPFEE